MLEPISKWRGWGALGALFLMLGCSLGQPDPEVAALSGADEAFAARRVPSEMGAPARLGDAVTAENLYERESFWPYRIELTEPWRPEGHIGRFGWGVGVLVRVEEDGDLRVDFASDGKHRVPLEATNVLAEANRIRLGLTEKNEPNLVVALGNRLLDPSAGQLRALSRERLMAAESFFVVIANPAEPGFEALTVFAEDFALRHSALTVLLPSGGERDGRVANRIRGAGWESPFVLDRYALPLSRSLLDGVGDQAWLMWLSPEGKVLASLAWQPGSQEDVWTRLEAGAIARND